LEKKKLNKNLYHGSNVNSRKKVEGNFSLFLIMVYIPKKPILWNLVEY
jgi:hypothetical protein